MNDHAYYNEHDPYVAKWLRNLIAAGHIAPGEVDERSIEDVRPDDLRGFTQCHFFAGIGVWSYALRRSGWPDDRPVWTGSCPCQPFSAAGKGAGFADERHLWPAFYHLIQKNTEWCRVRERPVPSIFGEQVASKDADSWIDLVQTDLEALGYAFGAVPFPSAGVGAPHIRDRLYWVADSDDARLERRRGMQKRAIERFARSGSVAVRMADTQIAGRIERGANTSGSGERSSPEGVEQRSGHCGVFGGRMADAECERRERGQRIPSGGINDGPDAGWVEDHDGLVGSDEACLSRIARPGPTNGYWRDADWLGCRDGKWRTVESRPQPLADGSAESLGRVRADAIEKIEGEINAWAVESQISRTAAMRNLLNDLGAQAQRGWPAGRLPGLHEAPFLLSFLRQLQEQGWRIAEGVTLPRPEATERELRVLLGDGSASGAPREHGLAGQQSSERADALHFLSSLLARHAHKAWDHAYSTYAEIGFPLAHGARSRVGRLRGYGNAINAEAAAEFIRAAL